MSEIMWNIYRLFHDPPGTPKELKCIGCKVASGGLVLAASGASVIGGLKFIKPNVFKGMTFLGLGTCLFAASVVTFRMAYDDQKYNEQLTKDLACTVRNDRRANKESSIASAKLGEIHN